MVNYIKIVNFNVGTHLMLLLDAGCWLLAEAHVFIWRLHDAATRVKEKIRECDVADSHHPKDRFVKLHGLID
jgi:hypothetical protein